MSAPPATTTPAAEDPLGRLRSQLQRLRLHSGDPSAREIARKTDKAVSHTTVTTVLRCGKNPRWSQLEIIVEALKGDVEQFRPLWIAAEEAKRSTLQTPPIAPDARSVPLSASAVFSPVASSDVVASSTSVIGHRTDRQPLTGHTDTVWGVAFAPDGHLLATTSYDRTVRLWNPTTGEPVGDPLTDHTGSVWGVAFAPDGQLLATASTDGTVRLWNPTTGTQVGDPLTGHTSVVWGVAFAPDGQLVATTSHDGTVRLWNPTTGTQVGDPLTGHTSVVYGVAFAPDGHLLATTSHDGTVRLWNPTTGNPVGDPLTGHTDAVYGVAFAPDGHLLATTSSDGTVRLWNLSSSEPVSDQELRRRLHEVRAENGALRRQRDDLTARVEMLTAAQDRMTELLDALCRWPRLVTGHTDAVYGVAFAPDGHLLATTSDDRTVRLWNPTTGEPVGHPLTGHTGAVLGVAFAPDGHLLATTSDDRTVRLWPVWSAPMPEPRV